MSTCLTSLLKRKSTNSRSSLENICPAGVLLFGDTSFCQHVITHITEYLELFFTGENMCLGSGCNHPEHLCLSHSSEVQIGAVGIDSHFFTTTFIGNALEQFNVHLFNAVENGAAELNGLSVVADEWCHGWCPCRCSYYRLE